LRKNLEHEYFSLLFGSHSKILQVLHGFVELYYSEYIDIVKKKENFTEKSNLVFSFESSNFGKIIYFYLLPNPNPNPIS